MQRALHVGNIEIDRKLRGNTAGGADKSEGGKGRKVPIRRNRGTDSEAQGLNIKKTVLQGPRQAQSWGSLGMECQRREELTYFESLARRLTARFPAPAAAAAAQDSLSWSCHTKTPLLPAPPPPL